MRFFFLLSINRLLPKSTGEVTFPTFCFDFSKVLSWLAVDYNKVTMTGENDNGVLLKPLKLDSKLSKDIQKIQNFMSMIDEDGHRPNKQDASIQLIRDGVAVWKKKMQSYIK